MTRDYIVTYKIIMDRIFKALNDQTRRDVLDALRIKDGQTLSELEEHVSMTRFGLMKHLKILEEAHLITTRKMGRFKYHYLNVVPLQETLDRWIEPLVYGPTARAVLNLKSTLEKTMNAKPDFVHQTFIRTPSDRLWEALTDPQIMAAYHFLCNEVRGQVSKGNVVEFVQADGQVMLRQAATKLTPKTRIEMTFEPVWMGPDAPPSHMVYEIEDQGDVSKLTVEHYNIAPGQEGFAEGWIRLVASLKSYLETGNALKLTA